MALEREIVGVCVFKHLFTYKGSLPNNLFFFWLPHNCTRNKKIEPLRDKEMVKKSINQYRDKNEKK